MQFLSTTLAISFAPEIAERTFDWPFLPHFPRVGLEGWKYYVHSEFPIRSAIRI
jgi:hypothetical protein